MLATDTVPGLQIFHAGVWRDVPPRPGCFVVNVGGAHSVLDLCNDVGIRCTAQAAGMLWLSADRRVYPMVCKHCKCFQLLDWLRPSCGPASLPVMWLLPLSAVYCVLSSADLLHRWTNGRFLSTLHRVEKRTAGAPSPPPW